MFHNTIVPQSADAVAQWDVSRLLYGRSWVRNQVGVDEFFQGKITQIFVPILKQDFVSSQSAFIRGIRTSEILKNCPIQN